MKTWSFLYQKYLYAHQIHDIYSNTCHRNLSNCQWKTGFEIFSKREVILLFFEESRSHQVRRGSNECTISTKTGSKRQCPPEKIRIKTHTAIICNKRSHHWKHHRCKRNIVKKHRKQCRYPENSQSTK